jgi:hypothetical protein
MSFRIAALAAAATVFAGSLPGVSGALAAPIAYSINYTITSANPTGNPLQSDTVNGSITTDGTIGVIATPNILSYTLDLIDNLNAANNFSLTPANSSIVLNTGSALSGSATTLSFDFSGTGEFLIQANSPGPFSGSHYFCFSTGVFACLAGVTIAPQNVFVDGVVATGFSAPIGVQPLGPPVNPTPVSSVPEPATIALLGLGLAGLGMVRRRRGAMAG